MSWALKIGRSLCLAGLILLTPACAAVQGAESKRVMLLHSFGRDFKPWDEYARTIRTELERQSPWPLDIIDQSLVAARAGDDDAERTFAEYLRALYTKFPVDLIVCIGAPAAAFVQRNRPNVFANIPMVFTAVDERRVQFTALTPNDVAVPVRIEYLKAIQNILRVLPQTKNVVVVVGGSPLEKFWKEEIGREVKPLADRLAFSWTDTLSFEQLLQHAAALPPNSVIFWELMIVDAAGVVHEGNAAIRQLHDATNAPIFSYDDTFFGRNIVGGPMLSVPEGSRQAVAVAIRILGGEKAGDIKVPPIRFTTPKFDWREMQRWGIPESRLPAGSQIYFRESTAWERYRWQISGILAALALQAALIAWLVYEHRRRSVAEVQSRNAMAELAHLNRLETAGQLSASIAHEINQPVTGIILKASAALRWLAVDKPDVEKVRSALADIVGAGERAGSIIAGVRAMFKKDTGTKAAINLNNLINTVLALLRLDLQKDGVRIETRLDEQLRLVTGDPVQLQQVILNLIVNAEEAMRGAEPRILTVRTNRSTAGTVRVSIEDSGPGIGESDRVRIFDPLFTTKAGGMGMGLSICRSIVENHGGKIWVEAAAARGAVFQFELPATRVHMEPQGLAA